MEKLLAAVAQTQGFDDDEPGSPPRVENSKSSPEIQEDVAGSQQVGAPGEVSEDARPSSAANSTPETKVKVVVHAIAAVEKRKRGRPPKGQLTAKPPAPKRKKEQEEEEEEDVCFICFDGGSLVLCDRKGCPKAYHPSCIKRDEAFFKSKAKWNCGWHICSVCRKSSYYMCYTCPYSLCKGCTKDEDYVRVRGNKGFCTTCMKTIMLIENKDQTNSDSAVPVDFDDITSWEYLFKMYWVILKENLSLTMKELTRARKPWKGVAPMVCKPQLSNVNHTAVDERVSIPNSSSEHLDMSKLQEVHVTADLPDGSIVSKESKSENTTNGKIITAKPGAKNPVTEKAIDYPSIEDAADLGATDKPHVDHIEMPKDLEPHNLVKEDYQKNSSVVAGLVDSSASNMEVDGNNFDHLMGIKNRKQETCEKHEERETRNDSSKYAAIDGHNVNLIYLRRNSMVNLFEDKENFLFKVVGSIVRIRISSDDQKPDVYRLVQVVGISKVSKPYKIGDKMADFMLEVLNLGRKEVVSVDAISNQEFTEAECRQLDQYIRCGLLKQYTLDEVQKKAMALQSVRFDAWLEEEVLRLYHLLDQASKKGCEEEVSEYVRKIQLIKSPEERQRRISEVPEIHIDTETGPNYESENARSSGSNIKDDHRSPRRSLSPVSEKKPISPIENGKEEGPMLAQSKTTENIDACGSQCLEKHKNQVDNTVSAINGGDDQAMVRSEVESSTAVDPVVNSLADDNIEIEKLWHYRDCNGKIQGPFSMMHLRLSSTTRHFPTDMRIWTNHEQYDSLLLTDALNGKLHGPSELPHNLSSGLRECKAANENNGDSKQTDEAQCNSASASLDNNGVSMRADEASWPKCWDLFKDKSSSAQDVPAIPSSSLSPISVAPELVRERDEFNHVAKEIEKIFSGSTENETDLTSQSCEEKLIPLPIGLSLNDIEPVSVPEPISKSPTSIKQEMEMEVSNLPSPKHSEFLTAEKQQSESPNVPIQYSGFLELLSLKPRSDSEDQESRVAEIKQPAPVNLSVPDSGPSWSSQLNMMAGGVQFPEMANDWFGFTSAPAKQNDITCDNVGTSDNNQFTQVSPPHPASNIPSWLAMINEPIEFDALGEESVSDLLAEVDAMESQGTLPSPTSAMKFAKELIQDCKDDCFSSIEDFSPTPDHGRSDAFSSTGEIQLSGQSSVPCRPVGQSLIDALDSFSRSGVHSSGSSAGETNAPVYTGEAVSEFHRAPPNMSQDMVNAAMAPGNGPEFSDPGWGAVQGNINLVTVQGNVNLVLGGPTQGMTNLGWGTSQGTAWGNPNMNHNPINSALPWDGQRKYNGERFPNGREWGGYQGVETGFGRGRPPWGRPPYGGGGGYSRPVPKGQRVCKFYESGRCKKGAFCDYLHP